MKTERLILSLVAIIIGILVAGGGFLLYQYTQQNTNKTVTPITPQPSFTPSPSPKVSLSISSPKDEDVVSTSQITVSGKTEPNTTVLVSTDSNDSVVTAGNDGSFSAKITLDSGENPIDIIAITPNGEKQEQVNTVTYSTESF